LLAVSAAYLNSATVAQALEHVRTYKPDVYMPAHHDARFSNLWRSTEPLFQAVKDENPRVVTVSKGYREPTASTPSTISAAAAEPARRHGAPVLSRPARAGAGNHNRTVRPGALSSVSICAPCRRATAATRLSPRPLPGICRLRSSR
jgi:hypothetical protein